MADVEDFLCKRCQGAGSILAPEWEDWLEEHREMPPAGHPLYEVPEDAVCPECGGEGTAEESGRRLRTDTLEEAVSTLETFAGVLGPVWDDPCRWKWAIILLHGAVQGFMASAARGDRQDDPAREVLKTYGQEGGEERLDGFLGLYKRMKGIGQGGSQERSMKRLNGLRNKLLQFAPAGWSIDLDDLPALCLDCLGVVESLVKDSERIAWPGGGLRERALNALDAAERLLGELHRHLGPLSLR